MYATGPTQFWETIASILRFGKPEDFITNVGGMNLLALRAAGRLVEVLPRSFCFPRRTLSALYVAAVVSITPASTDAASNDAHLSPSIPVSGGTEENVSGFGTHEAKPHLNRLVLDEIKKMPLGGGYATTTKALESLRSAMWVGGDGVLAGGASHATPSFCSGATYLLFLQVIRTLQLQSGLKLSSVTAASLVSIHGPDGHGIWGRWNANGPGTARLFFELGIGKSFVDFESAMPGDFMKIWWTNEIGKSERGHSVVFLGAVTDDQGMESVRFWSSNIPDGYGEKVVPRAKIKRALFSRFERPSALNNFALIPRKDAYLKSMLVRGSTESEVSKQCGLLKSDDR
jgi:hypothetical protein